MVQVQIGNFTALQVHVELFVDLETDSIDMLRRAHITHLQHLDQVFYSVIALVLHFFFDPVVFAFIARTTLRRLITRLRFVLVTLGLGKLS